MSAEEGVYIKEHKYGCSVQTPHCTGCGKYFNSLGHKMQKYVTGGFYFYELFFYCSNCRIKVMVPQSQIDTLNKFTTPSRESFDRVLWPPLPEGFTKNRLRMGTEDTFYPQ